MENLKTNTDFQPWPEQLDRRGGKEWNVTNQMFQMFFSYRLGRAIKEMLVYFRWNRVALLATDDRAARKCYFIVQGMHTAFIRSPVKIEWRMELDYISPTDEDLQTFVEGMKKTARSEVMYQVAPVSISLSFDF